MILSTEKIKQTQQYIFKRFCVQCFEILRRNSNMKVVTLQIAALHASAELASELRWPGST